MSLARASRMQGHLSVLSLTRRIPPVFDEYIPSWLSPTPYFEAVIWNEGDSFRGDNSSPTIFRPELFKLTDLQHEHYKARHRSFHVRPWQNAPKPLGPEIA